MKKVLSFVLVLALVLSSFSMAFAGETTVKNLTDVAGNANEEAIQVAYDLGIVTGNPDGTFQPEKAVTRAEFAAMITRALAIPDSALAGYATTSFKDTNGYSWAVPYLAFCNSKGIMLGDGAGNAMPGKTITVNEAVTMALRAVGYTANSAELVGVWPANYVTKAQDLGLYDDVAKDAAGVNKANAAQIIYNTLTVDKVAVNSDGKTEYVLSDIKDADGNYLRANMLTAGLNCKPTEDYIIDSNDYGATKIDLTSYIGACGTVYVDDNGKGDIVAFCPDSVALTGSFDGDDFEVGDVTYTFKAGSVSDAAILLNASTSDAALGTNDLAKIQAAEAAADIDLTIHADVSGKTIKQVYSVCAWEVTHAEKAEKSIQEDIEDNELLGYEFEEDVNKEIDETQFALVGVSSLDKIAEDNVVYVFTEGKLPTSKIRMVAVGTETVEGKVTETKSGTQKIWLGGTKYDRASASNVAVPAIGKEYKLYLDAYGDYYDAKKVAGTADNFAVIESVKPGDSFDNTKVKAYLSTDSEKTLYFADDDDDIDYLVNGDVKTWDEISTGAIQSFVANVTDGALVGYELDSEGNIDTLDLGSVVANNSEVLVVKSAKTATYDGNPYTISSDVVVFQYEGTANSLAAIGAADLEVIKITDVKYGTVSDATHYAQIILNDDNEIVAIVISDGMTETDTDDVYGVFSEKKNALDADDDDIFSYVGFIGKEEGNFKTDGNGSDEGSGLSFADMTSSGALGVVYKIELTNDGVIDKITSLYSTSAVAAAGGSDGTAGYLVIGATVTKGGIDDNVITFDDGSQVEAAKDVIVYEAILDGDDVDYYRVSSVSRIKSGNYVWAYYTDVESKAEVANVIIFCED